MEDLEEKFPMSQEQFIDALLDRSEYFEYIIEESKVLQKNYEEYLAKRDEITLNEFMKQAVRVLREDATRRMKYWYRWTEDVSDEAEQMIMIWLNEILAYLDSQDRVIDNFGAYAREAIRNKIEDWRKKTQREREFYGYEAVDDDRRNDGIVEGEDGNNRGGYWVDHEKLERVYEKLFKIYCYTLVNESVYPPKLLALCYARILSHIDFDVHYTKRTSPKWAMDRMGGDSIFLLTEKSQGELQQKVDDEIAWCGEYLEWINKKEIIKDREEVLGCFIYTEVFTKDEVENWSRTMNEKVVKDMKRIGFKNDEEFYDMVTEYMRYSSVLWDFINKKGKK